MPDEKKTIGIITHKVLGVPAWDPDSVQSGITGSEEAVIYISQELAELGYQVIVFGNPPENSPYSAPSANPRYVDIFLNDYQHLDIAISWRMPAIAQALKNLAKKVYLWPHDICAEKLTPQQIEGFDDVLWLSKWQRSNWISINAGFSKFKNVFGNGVLPEQFSNVEERKNPFSCIYGSNYARGLELLIDMWPKVKTRFPKATLDIYYGWECYNLLSANQKDLLRSNIKRLSSQGVSEKGRVGHEELNRAYANASFWTYPCTQAETFCITALRAQFAGAIPVILESSALAETVRHGYKCFHPNHYLHTLLRAMREAEKIDLNERSKMREFISQEYTWKIIARKWRSLFECA
jgi:glycosyltransferase involved in cell wall biosynthesis